MSSSGTGVPVWKSPIPYLFGSLALVLLLISGALIIIVCSYWKRASNSSADDQNDLEKPAMIIMNTAVDTEPKIVVVMAGDDKPSHLANPTTISSTCPCEQL